MTLHVRFAPYLGKQDAQPTETCLTCAAGRSAA